LVKAKVREKFRIFLEMRCKGTSWFISWLLVPSVSKDLLVLEKASLRDKDLDIVINGEDHKVPIDDIEYFSLHGDDVVGRVPPLHHVIEGLSAWILDLKVLGGDQQAHQRDKDGVILLVSGHLG
jgi:hypothetical protein